MSVCFCRLSGGVTYEQAKIRLSAANDRSADPQDARAPADARLGDHAAHSADLRWSAPGQPGIALSGAPAPRTTGMDYIRMGNVGEQPPGKVLQTNSLGSEAA